jgi:hypothetical protein
MLALMSLWQYKIKFSQVRYITPGDGHLLIIAQSLKYRLSHEIIGQGDDNSFSQDLVNNNIDTFQYHMRDRVLHVIRSNTTK